jgi:hypothetical protein
VNIGTHEQKPTDVRCVDCNSFECSHRGTGAVQ